MNAIAKVGLITGGILAADAGYLVIRRAINVAKANKTIRKMESIEGGIRLADQEVPENIREFSKDAISEMLSKGELIYLKPVEHLGKTYPVSVVIADFGSIESDWCNLVVETETYSKDQLYNKLFAAIQLQVICSGGAFTTEFTTAARLGLFKSDSEETDFGSATTGILILIDKRLSALLSDEEFETVLHHEYYHAMKCGGIIDTILSMPDIDKSSVDSKEVINIPEEIEADGFAKLHTGVDMRQALRKIFECYLPEIAEVYPKSLGKLVLHLMLWPQGR